MRLPRSTPFEHASWLLIALLLSACQPQPETYAPPVQRQPLEDFRPYHSARVVQMNDADAEAFFVRDINTGAPEGGTWRWTGKRPTIRLHPRSSEGLSFFIDFTIPDVTFKDTGPVTITFFINGAKLESVRYTEPGRKEYRKLAPVGWIFAGQPAELAAEIDKTWTSKDDPTVLGFVLSRFGLEPPAGR